MNEIELFSVILAVTVGCFCAGLLLLYIIGSWFFKAKLETVWIKHYSELVAACVVGLIVQMMKLVWDTLHMTHFPLFGTWVGVVIVLALLMRVIPSVTVCFLEGAKQHFLARSKKQRLKTKEAYVKSLVI